MPASRQPSRQPRKQPRKQPEWWRKSPVAVTGLMFDHRPGDEASSEKDLIWPSAVDESAWPFYALLLFTFILLLAPQQVFPVLAPLRIAMLSIVLVIVVHTGSRLSRQLPVMTFPAGVIFALMLTAWAIVTIPLSVWPGGSLGFLTDQYFKTIVVFLLLANVISTIARLKAISWALVLMAIPLAATAINNLLSGVTMGGGQRIVGYNAPLAENPNDMALLLNLFLPVAIALYISASTTLRKSFLLAVILLMICAIFATFSRAGFLTLAVTFFCYMVLLRNRAERFYAPTILLLCLVLLPFMPGDYIGRISTITNIETDTTGSAQTRLSDSVAAVGLVMQNPLTGAGVGMNTLVMNEARGSTWTEIHNVYLTIAVELGLPGLLLFLLLLVAAIKSTNAAINVSRNNPRLRDLYCIAEALKVSLLAFSVAALFHPVAYHFYFYYIAGLAMALQQIIPCANGINEGKTI